MGDGSDSARDDLIQAHWREVYGTALAITRNPATAEDLAQEVFVVAAKKRVGVGGELSAWFRRVARYLALNELRRKRPETCDPFVLAETAAKRDPAGAAGAAQFEEKLAALRESLRAMPEEDRRMLAGFYAERLSLAGLARREGRTEGYVKLRLFRLRKHLGERVRVRLAESEVLHARR